MDRIINRRTFFLLVLIVILGLYTHLNQGVGINSLSSDVWGYQFLELYERFGYWSDVPPSYNQSEWYIVFPLFYYLNPGLEGNLISYHLLAIAVIASSYLLSGIVVKNLFKSWTLATIAGLLVVIPRYAFPTKIGILGIGTLRGNILFTPFYLLTSYYWITHGINDKKKNVILGAITGSLIYIYPPSAITWAGVSIFAAFMVYGRQYLKQIGIFVAVAMLVTTPFWVNHFSNPYTSMLDRDASLTAEQLALKASAVREAFAGNGFIASVEFEEMKRIVWDQSPFLLFFILSLFLTRKYKEEVGDDIRRISQTSLWIVVALVFFVGSIEILNWVMMRAERPPVFIEHFRQLRGVGFIFFMQFIVLLHILFLKGRRYMPYAFIIFTLVTPIVFFAPVLRATVRAVVPEDIRLRYNLAPIVPPSEMKDFDHLVAVGLWARKNLSQETAKFFVFDEYQDEFKFKFLSRHDTNLTQKEGTIWVTSGYKNAERWYLEREKYKSIVPHAKDFSEIAALVKELDSSHILLPRGYFSELYEQTNLNLQVIYSNPAYRILEL